MQVDRWKTLAVSNFWTFGNVSSGHFVVYLEHWLQVQTPGRRVGREALPCKKKRTSFTDRSFDWKNGLNAAKSTLDPFVLQARHLKIIQACMQNFLTDGFTCWHSGSSFLHVLPRFPGSKGNYLAPEWFGSTVVSLEQCCEVWFNHLSRRLPCWSLTEYSVFGVGNSSFTRPALAGHCAGRLQRRLETKQGGGNMSHHPAATTLMTGHCPQKGHRGVRLLQQHQRLGFSTKHEMAWEIAWNLKHNLGRSFTIWFHLVSQMGGITDAEALGKTWSAQIRGCTKGHAWRTDPTCNLISTMHLSTRTDMTQSPSGFSIILCSSPEALSVYISLCYSEVQVSLHSSALQVLSEPVPHQTLETDWLAVLLVPCAFSLLALALRLPHHPSSIVHKVELPTLHSEVSEDGSLASARSSGILDILKLALALNLSIYIKVHQIADLLHWYQM